MAAQADMGVAFAEMKKSKRAMLREWRQICERYKLPLAGSVAVQRCWYRKCETEDLRRDDSFRTSAEVELKGA